MQKTFESVLDKEGRPIKNASVTILNYPAGTVATIYSDNGITQKTNPFLTDSNGLYEFYTANGRYSIKISGANLVTTQINDILVSDAIADNSITNAKLAPVPAKTFKGNNTNATANVLDLTATQLTAELNTFFGDTGAGGTKGLVPAPIAGDAAKYLRADGTWQIAVSGTSNAAHEYVIATGTSSAYLLTPVLSITAYALNQSQIYEVQWNVDCVDNPTAAISGLAAKNIVVLASDGTYQNASARDIVAGSVSTLETIDVGAGVLKLWLKDPAVIHSYLNSVSVNTAFTVATALSKVIKSTGSAARQHTLPVFSTWPIEGRFDLIAENSSMQIARQNAGDVIDYYGVNLATDGVTGAFIDVPAGTQITFIKTATSWQITSTLNRQNISKLPNITVTQAANAATITLGAFSADFRNASLTSGTPNTRTLSVNASLVIQSGATLGVPTVGTISSVTATNSTTLALNTAPSAPIQIGDVLAGANIPTNTTVASFGTYVGGVGTGTIILSTTVTTTTTAATFTKPSRIMILAIDNAGTLEVACVNQSGGNNLDENGVISTTAITSGSTANNVIYSTTARTSVPYKVVGYMDIANPVAGQYSVQQLVIVSASGRELAAMWAIGNGQIWQNVAAQRVVGQTYYNTSGRPTKVNFVSSANSPSVVVNGVTIQASATNAVYTSFEVPAGASYSFGNTPTTASWFELK